MEYDHMFIEHINHINPIFISSGIIYYCPKWCVTWFTILVYITNICFCVFTDSSYKNNIISLNSSDKKYE